jgi:hypothetical protein
MMRQVLYEISRGHAAKVQLQKEVQAVSETLNSDQTLFVSAWADYDRDDVVTLWVATCLSAGVNPNHKAARSKDFAQEMVAIGSAADDCIKKLNEVLRRYKNVSIHAKNPNSSLNTADELHTKIELSAFRKWVEAEKNWELPKGFPGARALLAGPDQPNVETPSPAPAPPAVPVVADSAPGGVKPIPNLSWWRATHDIHEMAQNIGAARHSKGERTSNTEIAKEIEKRINNIERSKARDRRAPNWDTIRGVLTGWTWRPE